MPRRHPTAASGWGGRYMRPLYICDVHGQWGEGAPCSGRTFCSVRLCQMPSWFFYVVLLVNTCIRNVNVADHLQQVSRGLQITPAILKPRPAGHFRLVTRYYSASRDVWCQFFYETQEDCFCLAHIYPSPAYVYDLTCIRVYPAQITKLAKTKFYNPQLLYTPREQNVTCWELPVHNVLSSVLFVFLEAYDEMPIKLLRCTIHNHTENYRRYKDPPVYP